MRIVSLDGRDNPAAILYETTVTVPATPGWVTIYPNLTGLAPGQPYGIEWLAPRIFDNTSGAYGWGQPRIGSCGGSFSGVGCERKGAG